MSNGISGGGLRPLNELMQQRPQQQVQQQVPQQQYQPQQQVPQQQYPQQQQVAPSNDRSYQLSDMSQLDGMRNDGRVQVVVQNQQGYVVVETDQLNINAIAQQNPQLGQELRLFDSNNDGWIVEAELKSMPTPVGMGGEEEVSSFQHIAQSALGSTMFGGAVGGLANKFGLNLGAKFGVKGWVAGAIGGAAIGTVAGFITDPNRNKDADNTRQYSNVTGYRPETQWNNSGFIRTIQ